MFGQATERLTGATEVKLFMLERHLLRCVCLCATLFLACAALAGADTIVLKNGRKIAALSAVIEGDKVRYETPSGTLTLPKSIVDHIDKGAPGSFAAETANFAMAAPALAPLAFSKNDIEQNTIRDGAVDSEFIANLENGARGGSKEALQAAALAHHTAAQFEIAHGEMERAIDDERAALGFQPNESSLLLNLGYLHLKRSEFKQSLEYLDRARRIAPDDSEVSKLTGWAYYGLNKLDLAVTEWKKSLTIRPDEEVAAALAKAERDKEEEEGYKENESRHFTLKYSGAAEPDLAREVLHTLEAHYTAIESELNFSTPDSIGVILYTRQAFIDITNAPSWVGALNDGRLRIPVQGLTSMTPELSRVLKHELAHSFIEQKTHGLAPTWVQEGLAQWLEGKRSRENAAVLLQSFSAGQTATLTQLEGSWIHFTDVAVQFAYAWGLATIEAIVASSGVGDVVRILEHIATGEKPEAAVHAILNRDYNGLMEMTAEYLRKTYGQ
ncbi:MAG TPA: hypothetical protein VKP58_02685 [Candidatus Acidoferrum sp.]|nr:hypothetical protein [Candidatus Acidoferrum sp.]